MESLSDILHHLPKGSFMGKAEDTIQQLMNDPLIQRFRAQHPELDERTVKVNMNRLYQYVKEYRNCSNCPGLDKCPNDFTGHYTKLNVEALGESLFIHDDKVSCKKWLAKENSDAIRRRLRSFYVDNIALTRGYSSEEIMDCDADRVDAVGEILTYITQSGESGLPDKGLYLVGMFGTGKTFLMCYMLYEMAKLGFTGTIIYVPDFAEDLKSMFNEPRKIKETIDLLKETDLLVFDDMGAENLNPWLRDHVLGAILNYRMNRKPTFYTSNYDLDALEEHFSITHKDGEEQYKGQRIMDRIRPFVQLVRVNGSNKRGRTRSQ